MEAWKVPLRKNDENVTGLVKHEPLEELDILKVAPKCDGIKQQSFPSFSVKKKVISKTKVIVLIKFKDEPDIIFLTGKKLIKHTGKVESSEERKNYNKFD